MEIYNQNMERIENPDLSLGYLKDDTRIERHEAISGVQEKWHYETVKIYQNGGKDVQRVIDIPGIPAKEAWDEEIQIQIYIPYTKEELDQMNAERSEPTIEDRITALEAAMAAQEAAYVQGVQSA